MARITSLLGNSQRLDGGAMFGNVPRALWQRWMEPDPLGRIPLACRCFLVEGAKGPVLIESGVGAFFEPRLAERFGVTEGEHILLKSLEEAGQRPEDIEHVVLSHLHFDHAGGLLRKYVEGRPAELVFPYAEFITSRVAWQRAKEPHPRDKASFIPELLDLLEHSGRLTLLEEGQSSVASLGGEFSFRQSSGHTPGMLIPTVHGEKETATFCADLVPGRPWVHLPVTMGYDRYPERVVDEKRALYEDLGEGACLLLTHDPEISAGRLIRSERGKYALVDLQPSLTGFQI